MKKNFSKFLAAMLAMMMVMGSVSVTNAGDPEPEPIVVENPIRVLDGSVTLGTLGDSYTLNGDLVVNTDVSFALSVESTNQETEGTQSYAHVTGSVTLEARGEALDLTASKGGTARADVDKDVAVSFSNSNFPHE